MEYFVINGKDFKNVPESEFKQMLVKGSKTLGKKNQGLILHCTVFPVTFFYIHVKGLNFLFGYSVG